MEKFELNLAQDAGNTTIWIVGVYADEWGRATYVVDPDPEAGTTKNEFQ